MDQHEYRQLARQVIGSILPRLPERIQRVVEIPLEGGELTYAIEDLTYALSQEPFPITQQEAQQLKDIYAHIHSPDATPEFNVVHEISNDE